MGYNPKKSTWLNPNIEYIFSDDIIEYDMRDAGFSLIKEYKLLPDDVIKSLVPLGKMERYITIGKMQGKDKEFSDVLMAKFAEMRSIFIGYNKIADDDIISVKKDAIFTTKECERLKFGGITFALKNRYTSYIRFTNASDIEIYNSHDDFDIKGLGDSAINRHRIYLIEFIRKIMFMIENKDRRAKKEMKDFIMRYKSFELEEGYYLEFNNKSHDIDPLFNFQKIIIPILQIIIKEIG